MPNYLFRNRLNTLLIIQDPHQGPIRFHSESKDTQKDHLKKKMGSGKTKSSFNILILLNPNLLDPWFIGVEDGKKQKTTC